MGYGNAVEDVAAPSPVGWTVAHANPEIVFGFVTRSSCIRVSRHQNLGESVKLIKRAISPTNEADHLPKRGFTIPYVLTLPLYHI